MNASGRFSRLKSCFFRPHCRDTWHYSSAGDELTFPSRRRLSLSLIARNSTTVNTIPITIRPKALRPLTNSMVSFMVAGSHHHQLEVDSKTENRRDPDRGENAFHPLTVEPQESRDEKRNHDGQQEKEIGFPEHKLLLHYLGLIE
jgi:hypothetical protein